MCVPWRVQALERAVPKDTLGRINYYQVAELVAALTGGAAEGDAGAAAGSS